MLETLVAEDGSGDWEEKARALGTGRTAKSVENKWYRHSLSGSPGMRAKPSPKPEMPPGTGQWGIGHRSGLGTYRRTPWSLNEDDLLRKAVKTFRSSARGRQDILFSAAMVPGRSGKQCRERWRNHVDPSISREPWSEEENALLLRLYEEHYGRWCEISVAFAGRPDEA